jgi:hypothetical protein
VPEVGNHWFNTYHRHHLEQLGIHQSTLDPCLLFYNNKNDKNDNSFGIVGMQTDDTLLLADEAFAEAEENRLQEAGFFSKNREKLTSLTPIKFNGGQIE